MSNRKRTAPSVRGLLAQALSRRVKSSIESGPEAKANEDCRRSRSIDAPPLPGDAPNRDNALGRSASPVTRRLHRGSASSSA